MKQVFSYPPEPHQSVLAPTKEVVDYLFVELLDQQSVFKTLRRKGFSEENSELSQTLVVIRLYPKTLAGRCRATHSVMSVKAITPSVRNSFRSFVYRDAVRVAIRYYNKFECDRTVNTFIDGREPSSYANATKDYRGFDQVDNRDLLVYGRSCVDKIDDRTESGAEAKAILILLLEGCKPKEIRQRMMMPKTTYYQRIKQLQKFRPE